MPDTEKAETKASAGGTKKTPAKKAAAKTKSKIPPAAEAPPADVLPVTQVDATEEPQDDFPPIAGVIGPEAEVAAARQQRARAAAQTE